MELLLSHNMLEGMGLCWELSNNVLLQETAL